MNISPEVALARLKAGNDRFVNGLRSIDSLTSLSRRVELATSGQRPFSIILTCSDSRVPAEIIFDVGLGDLFVVRVAGNVVAPSVIASIEYAAAALNVQLCIVLGHSQCGAVQAAVDYRKSGICPSENIRSLIDQIMPAVNAANHNSNIGTKECHLDDIIRHNVSHSEAELLRGSPLLSKLVADGKLAIVGATYDLKTGQASFDNPYGAIETSSLGQPVRSLMGQKPSSNHFLTSSDLAKTI